jgi:hypothetical protein
VDIINVQQNHKRLIPLEPARTGLADPLRRASDDDHTPSMAEVDARIHHGSVVVAWHGRATHSHQKVQISTLVSLQDMVYIQLPVA